MSSFLYKQGVLTSHTKNLNTKLGAVYVDFFDTLLIRKTHPSSVFQLVNSKLAIIRQFSEIIQYRFGNRNPNIEKIVKFIPGWKVLDEINAEVLSLALNIELLKDLQFIQSTGLEVYVVSDTYFSSEQLYSILEKFTDWKPTGIVTSSQMGVSKSQGLYKLAISITDKLSEKSIIVGDDLYADGLNALQERCLFFWILTEKQINGTYKYVDLEVFSMQILEPLVELFMGWLKNEINAMKPDQIFFLSRDTIVFKELWTTSIKSKIETHYVPASRKVSIESGHLDTKKDGVVYAGARVKYNKQSLKKPDVFKEFYEKYVNGSEKIALIDLGWNGTFQDALQTAFPKTDFYGLYLGVLPHNTKNPRKKGFLFSPESNNRKFVKQTKKHINILEVIFASNEGTLLSIENGIKRRQPSNFDELTYLFTDPLKDGLISAKNRIPSNTFETIEALEMLNTLSINAPEWFIKASTIIRHKISPLNNHEQPLILTSRGQVKTTDRIWWPSAQSRYQKILRKRNRFLWMINNAAVLEVKIRFLIRIFLNLKYWNKIIKRLWQLSNPKGSNI